MDQVYLVCYDDNGCVVSIEYFDFTNCGFHAFETFTRCYGIDEYECFRVQVDIVVLK